jgi:YidC/Oxa1 family membrane protein insertase
MEKRVFLTIIISLLILVAYQHFVASRFQPPKKAQAPVLTEPASSPPPTPAVSDTPGPLPAPALESELSQELEAQRDYYLQDIEINTDLYRAVVTNKGGRIKSWVLLKYLDNDGNPLDLVSPSSQAADYYPLSLVLDDKALARRLNTSLYKVERVSSPEEGRETVVFSYLDASGIRLSKRLTFYYDNYYVDIDIQWENLADTPRPLKYYLDWGYDLGPQVSASSYNHHGPSLLIDGELVKDKPSKIKGKLEHEGNISWAALQDTYFAAMLIPKTVTSEVLITKREKERISVGLAAEEMELTPGAVVSQQFGLYVGPQKVDKLKAVGVGLEKIIDYGWFSFLAKPIMEVLKFFHRYSGNYGVDIIILTVLIKILFWPLTNASFKSMKDMQKIQPKISALRQKYKSDPQRLNREIMELYKKHKVNPLGGCMPMALQIPVFFALYKALLISIELRHAPFFLWITDLSAAEPGWFGLWQAPSAWLNLRTIPLLMGVTMFIQQKMTPSSSDPKQAKMMMLMPVFMTAIFWNMPTGLVLYFLLNNVLTIGQQYMINKKEA